MKSIEKLADELIKDAVRHRATDIHFIPRKEGLLVQMRIGNKLLPRMSLGAEQSERIISHFKFTASMDIGERRRPQSGSFSMNVDKQMVSLRLSTLPANQKESLVIRILPQMDETPFCQISLFPKMTAKLLSLLRKSSGLMILTGPTGSGKTTALHALLSEGNRLLKRNIIALEDPVEKENNIVLQVQVNEKAGISYAAGLKAILRHDPDIIMVGEIRDSETAKIAVRASLTGHLVLTTMHTKDAKGAVYRLREFGIGKAEIEQTLTAVTAQRLVELTCPYCQNGCSPFCFSYNRRKRAVVFELLSGNALLDVIRGKKEKLKEPLEKAIRKGIALGYIVESEYDRWVFADEEE